MSVTTLAGTSPRTSVYAAPAKPRPAIPATPRVPPAPHTMPNKAGQVGPVSMKTGIVNTGARKAK